MLAPETLKFESLATAVRPSVAAIAKAQERAPSAASERSFGDKSAPAATLNPFGPTAATPTPRAYK